MKRIYIGEYDYYEQFDHSIGVCSDEKLEGILKEINDTFLDYDSEEEKYFITFRDQRYTFIVPKKGKLAHCEIMKDVFELYFGDGDPGISLEVEDISLLD
jgi:hypothetical protein